MVAAMISNFLTQVVGVAGSLLSSILSLL